MRTQQQTAATVTGWLREGRRVAAGLLVAVDGSAPLDVGASMYIDEDGAIEGSITGGCVEGAVAQEAMEILEAGGAAEARHLRDLRRARRHGRADVRRHRPHLHPRAARRAREAHHARRSRRSSTERPAALVTLLDGEQRGREALRRRRAAASARLGGAALLDAQRRARGPRAHRSRAARRSARSARTARRWAPACASTSRAYAEPPRMVIFGAIDFSSALAPLAKGVGYRVTIADPRTAFLRLGALHVDRRTRSSAWPDEALDGMTLGPRDAVLVFTHDPKLDVPALTAALGHRRRLHRRARQPQDDRRPRGAAARRRRRPTPRSRACTPPAGWTSAPRRSRRPRSRCSPRSSPRAPGAPASRCARPRARSAATRRTSPSSPGSGLGRTGFRRDLGSPDPKATKEAEGTMDWTHFEQLRVSGFTMTRRGYDKREVDRFLDSLAEWLETDAANELGDQAVQRKLELVGQVDGAHPADDREGVAGAQAHGARPSATTCARRPTRRRRRRAARPTTTRRTPARRPTSTRRTSGPRPTRRRGARRRPPPSRRARPSRRATAAARPPRRSSPS